MLTYGTLFSGIDGFAVAFDRLGWDLRFQVEQDAFCLDVLRHWWPHVPKHEDVCGVGGHNLPTVDVLAGGFPCQDISLAGAGAGLAGARSGLWSEFARVIRELRPRYVVVENVSALLARGMGVVLGDLAALGYDAEWDCIPASAVGAPHRRDRVWIVAYPDGSGRQQGQQDVHAREPDAEGCRRELADSDRQREPLEGRRDLGARPADSGARADVADPEGELRRPGLRRDEPGAGGRSEPADSGQSCRERELQDADSGALLPWRVGGRVAQAGGAEWWAVEPPVGRVAHGVPNRLDQLAALGNALVPQIPEWIGQRIVDHEKGGLSHA